MIKIVNYIRNSKIINIGIFRIDYKVIFYVLIRIFLLYIMKNLI